MKHLRLLVAFALATLSCQVILGLDEPKGVDGIPPAPPPPDASLDPCRHALPPPPPATDDDPAAKKSYWLATKKLSRVNGPGAPLLGFDLDNACTCAADLHDGGAPCVTPGAAPICDFDGGIDDGFAALTSTSVSSGFDPLKPINDEFEGGKRAMLLYLKDYNGKANDTDVGVELVNSGGLYTNLGCNDEPRAEAVVAEDDPDAGAPELRRRYRPLNDGCDRWSPADNQVEGKYPNRAPRTVGSAYVTNFDLVVTFREAGAALFGDATKLSSGVAVFRLSFDPKGKLRGDGVITGRVGSKELLDLFGRTPVTLEAAGDNQPLCQTRIWPFISAALCSARDTMTSRAEDFLGKSCDATSAAFGVEAVEVEISDLDVTNRQPPSACSTLVPCPP